MATASAQIDKIFHALGDPTRRNMLEHLGRGPMPASTLAGPLHITLAAVMQHLQVLEDSGLVETKKEGRVRTCSIQAKGISLAEKWLSERRLLWERRYDRLEELIGKEKAG